MTPFLPRTCSTSELCGLYLFPNFLLSLVEGVGFEPTKPFRAPDLQSGGISRSPTPPKYMYMLVYHQRKGQPSPLSSPSPIYSLLLYSPRGDSNPPTYRLQVGCAAIALLGRAPPHREDNFPCREAALNDNTISLNLPQSPFPIQPTGITTKGLYKHGRRKSR